MYGGGHAWQGACMAGACMVGVCMAGGHVWQGRGACMAGEMATAAGSTYPTGMHSCFFYISTLKVHKCRSKIILKNHQTEGENSVHSLSGLSPKLFLKKPSN